MKINRWSVVAAVLVTLVASFVWYVVFGRQYFELRGIDPDNAAATAMHPWQFPVLVARHLVVTLVIGYLVVRLAVVGRLSAVRLGVLLWLGFPVVLLAGSVASDNVPWQLAAIHAGDWLIKLVLIPVVLVAWPARQPAVAVA